MNATSSEHTLNPQTPAGLEAGASSGSTGTLIVAGVFDFFLYGIAVAFAVVFSGATRLTSDSYLSFLEEKGALKIKGGSDVSFRSLKFYLGFRFEGAESASVDKRKGLAEKLMPESGAPLVEKTGPMSARDWENEAKSWSLARCLIESETGTLATHSGTKHGNGIMGSRL